MRNTNRIHETIVTNMTDLCKWLNGDIPSCKIQGLKLEIVELKPIKGIHGEDIVKIMYRLEK